MSRATTNIDGAQFADRFAAEVRDRWHRGEEADVSALLQEWPGLEQHRSIVLDLAYHEYLQRLDRGESLSADQYSRRFPSLQRSLFMLIQVRQMLSRDSGIQALEHDVAWPETGDDFLGFRLLAELGRGTFGRVFLASEPALGDRLVALKVALGGDEEAEMLGRLRHTNVVPVHSIRKDPSSSLTAICMPYHGRTTLCDILDAAFPDCRPPTRARVVVEAVESLHDKSELPPENRIDRILRKGSYVDGMVHLAIQLSDALAYAHAKGICHRDLKPSNVLLSHECRPLLLDFNLSFDDQGGANRIGGTLPYMAPEQLAAIAGDFDVSPSLTDQRSDLFSLGVIFYELLAGTLPFGPVQWESSFQQTARLLLDRQACGPSPLREKNRRVDRRLADTIEKCLAFNPDDRPASAAKLADSLRKELRPARRAKRWIRSHRKAATVFAIVLATIFVALGIFLATRDPYHVRQIQRGRAYYQREEYDLAAEAFGNAIRSAPDPSEALLERGRALVKLGEYRSALEDLGDSYKLRPTPEGTIGSGYCLNRLRYHKEAIVAYRMAGETGQSSVAVLNNIGYSCLCVGDLEGAERALTEAARLDSHQQAVQYNLAILYLRLYRMKRPIPSDAYSHAAQALELGPPDSELCRLAATFCTIDPGADSQGFAKALTYLEEGISLGLDMAVVNRDSALRPLKGEPRYKQLMNTPRGRKAAEPTTLIDPL